mmetsp:Transcript_48281/g.149116  ORF Transcript_48281/g.149116 Transcript_48281/m.149116 type:complete len:283 (+) Transcript_48281:464-1312(+)
MRADVDKQHVACCVLNEAHGVLTPGRGADHKLLQPLQRVATPTGADDGPQLVELELQDKLRQEDGRQWHAAPPDVDRRWTCVQEVLDPLEALRAPELLRVGHLQRGVQDEEAGAEPHAARLLLRTQALPERLVDPLVHRAVQVLLAPLGVLPRFDALEGVPADELRYDLRATFETFRKLRLGSLGIYESSGKELELDHADAALLPSVSGERPVQGVKDDQVGLLPLQELQDGLGTLAEELGVREPLHELLCAGSLRRLLELLAELTTRGQVRILPLLIHQLF